jgi:hypothetical protein
MNQGLTNRVVSAVTVTPAPGVLYAGTNGGSIFRLSSGLEPRVPVSPPGGQRPPRRIRFPR